MDTHTHTHTERERTRISATRTKLSFLGLNILPFSLSSIIVSLSFLGRRESARSHVRDKEAVGGHLQLLLHFQLHFDEGKRSGKEGRKRGSWTGNLLVSSLCECGPLERRSAAIEDEYRIDPKVEQL